MDLITLRDIELAFGGDPLLEGVSLTVSAGERVCLLGRNGAGKTSLLELVTGEHDPEGGEIVRPPGVRIAHLPQSVPEDLTGNTAAIVGAGLRGGEAWDRERRLARVLSLLGLDADSPFEALSGGQQRRALLARALAADPDLLVLDEPTNHLDVSAIEWLEGLLVSWRGAVLFTTHDRRLIERVATRILELERGRVRSWPGDYANYLRRRAEREAAESRERERLDRRLAAEEAWIREGIKARRTRNEGRVRRLEAMREAVARRRRSVGRPRFEVRTAAASGRRVFEARDVAFDFGEGPIIGGFSTFVARGDRVGVIGPNGSGKTTLLRLLVGELSPSSGEILTGARVRVAYFDQHRARLDPAATVADSVADGAEHVGSGTAARHVIGYLRDFLFPPERARSPVGALSGGERARLLLARLFARPSNVLVMDEPTNDLDVETLELLEERLLEYAGSVLLVSHDRAFLDNVVTSTLVLEGNGRVGEYVGGYTDWLRQREPAADRGKGRDETRPAARRGSERPPRLGFNEKRELEALPGRIEALEDELAQLQDVLSDPELYRGEGAAIAAARDALDRAQAELEASYERWSELEARAGNT